MTDLVFVVDLLSLDRVIAMKLCVFACQSKQHGPLEVHPQLGVQVFLWCLREVGHQSHVKSPMENATLVQRSSFVLP